MRPLCQPLALHAVVTYGYAPECIGASAFCVYELLVENYGKPMNIQCIRVACVPAAATLTGRRKRGRFENDGGSCGAGGTGRAIACGVRGGMRAGFRSDQARSEED